MGAWDSYLERIRSHGASKREAAFIREKRFFDRNFRDSLSYKGSIMVGGEQKSVVIVDTDNLDEKFMFSMPGEDFACGDLVDWSDNHWLIMEKDANREIYTKVKLQQCNHLLRWIDENDVIHEQWCIVSDGTKYLLGSYEDRQFIVTRGDIRAVLIIGRNEHTVKFGRKHRFLIDDVDSVEKTAYSLTKPLKVGMTYNNRGVYSFILHEVMSTDDDNMELGIADYYKHFPRNVPNYIVTSDNERIISSDNCVFIAGDGSIPDEGHRGWL